MAPPAARRRIDVAERRARLAARHHLAAPAPDVASAAEGIAPHPDRWLSRVAQRTLSALRERGQGTARELAAAVPELTAKISFGEGRTWAGTVGLSTRLLFLLATEARIVRGRPLGTWVSSQYRWAETAAWLDGGLPAREPEAARTELVRRWLAAFGPGTLQDLAWWTGWPLGQTRQALAAARAVEVDLDAGTGFLLADDWIPCRRPPSG